MPSSLKHFKKYNLFQGLHHVFNPGGAGSRGGAPGGGVGGEAPLNSRGLGAQPPSGSRGGAPCRGARGATPPENF